MKKITVLLLIATMSMSMMACGSKNDNVSQGANTQQTEQLDTQVSEEPQTDVEDDTDVDTEDAGSQDDEVTAESVGDILMRDFRERVEANPQSTPQELADGLMANQLWEDSQIAGATMPVEPGLLNGFGNTEIRGFKEGVMFAPMIGSIPFIGYIFELEDGVDGNEFMELLSQNADMRWNVCTEAEEMFMENPDRIVIFMMSPKSFDEDM